MNRLVAGERRDCARPTRARAVQIGIGFGIAIGSAVVIVFGNVPARMSRSVVAAPPPTSRSPDALPTARPLASQAEVRAAVFAARAAAPADRSGLRDAALHAVDPTVAGAALRALGRLGLVAADAELLALADDPRPRIRQELLLALAAVDAPGTGSLLTRALDDPDASVAALARSLSAQPFRHR